MGGHVPGRRPLALARPVPARPSLVLLGLPLLVAPARADARALGRARRGRLLSRGAGCAAVVLASSPGGRPSCPGPRRALHRDRLGRRPTRSRRRRSAGPLHLRDDHRWPAPRTATTAWARRAARPPPTLGPSPTTGPTAAPPPLARPGAIKCDAYTAVGFDGATAYVSTATLVANPDDLQPRGVVPDDGGRRQAHRLRRRRHGRQHELRPPRLPDRLRAPGLSAPTPRRSDRRQPGSPTSTGAGTSSTPPWARPGWRLFVDGALVGPGRGERPSTRATAATGALGYDKLTGWPGAPRRRAGSSSPGRSTRSPSTPPPSARRRSRPTGPRTTHSRPEDQARQSELDDRVQRVGGRDGAAGDVDHVDPGEGARPTGAAAGWR